MVKRLEQEIAQKKKDLAAAQERTKAARVERDTAEQDLRQANEYVVTARTIYQDKTTQYGLASDNQGTVQGQLMKLEQQLIREQAPAVSAGS